MPSNAAPACPGNSRDAREYVRREAPQECSRLIVIPSLESAEYPDAVRRVREAVIEKGMATVMVKRQSYEVQRIYATMMPDRPLYIALNRRREFMRRTISELMAELVAVISSGSWSEFEFREDTDPVEALGDITGSFFSPPDEIPTRPKKNVSEIADPFVGAALIRRARRDSDSSSSSDL